MKRTRAVVVFTLAGLLIAGAEAAPPLWLAVGPETLLKEIAPLVEHRRAEGMEVLLSSKTPAEAVASAPRRPDYLLLVGDDAPGAEQEPWYVPSARRKFHGWQEKHRPDFASDFAWGGLDDRGVPLIPTGRFPVRTPAEAAALAAKVVNWEQQPPGPLALPMWAGDPLYAPEYTERFMAFLFAQLQRNMPAWMEPWVLSGDTKHPLAGPLDRQALVFNDRTGRGAIFSGMIGHGLPSHFLSYKVGKARIGYTVNEARMLTEGPPRPPHVIFACQSGKFTLPKDRCLAEELVMAPAGPVVCIAATEDSHPLPNFYTATCLLRRVESADGPARFGNVWLDAQRAARRRSDTLYELLLRDAEGRLKRGRADIDLIKLDQATLYAVMGDPATRVHFPRKLTAKIERTASGWRWSADVPEGATRLRVEQRGTTGAFPPRPAGSNGAEVTGAFEQASARLAFHPVATLPAAQPWAGECSEKGVLRLVAETPRGMYVAGFDLQ